MRHHSGKQREVGLIVCFRVYLLERFRVNALESLTAREYKIKARETFPPPFLHGALLLRPVSAQHVFPLHVCIVSGSKTVHL
jgi:hypothetical protein